MTLRFSTMLIGAGLYPPWATASPVAPSIHAEGLIAQCARLLGNDGQLGGGADSGGGETPGSWNGPGGGEYSGPGDTVSTPAPPFHGWGPSSPGPGGPGSQAPGGPGGVSFPEPGRPGKGGRGPSGQGPWGGPMTGSALLGSDSWRGVGVVPGLLWPTGRGAGS